MDTNKEKFVINKKVEYKIEPRVLNFEQMNKTLGLDLSKKPIIEKPSKQKIEKSSDSLDSTQDFCIDDLKTRMKAFQNRDLKADQEELLSFGMNNHEILPGEYINEQFDAEVLISNNKCNSLILLTNYRLWIHPINEKFLRCLKLRNDFLEIPYMYIETLKRNLDKKVNPPLALFEILTKDYREIKIKFIMDEELTLKSQEAIYYFLQNSINPSFVELYALQFAKTLKKLDFEFKGWELFSLDREFARQGLQIYENEGDPKDFQYKILDNSNGKVCSTYPEKLIVPSRIINDFLIRSANFRSRERLPVLCFGFSINKTSKKVGLWRCSQCKPGLYSNRSLEDEALVRAIGEDSLNNMGNVKIFDARPYMNAVANKVNGKGYEDINSYKNTELVFLEIPNIHKVRDAYRKIKDSGDEKPDFFPWLNCISLILKGTAEMVQCLKVFFFFFS